MSISITNLGDGETPPFVQVDHVAISGENVADVEPEILSAGHGIGWTADYGCGADWARVMESAWNATGVEQN